MNIFAVIHNESGRMYIGHSVNNSPLNFGSGKYIKQAIKKFGIDNFSKKNLESFDMNEPLSKVLERVEFWIKKYKTDNPEYGYNESVTDATPKKKKLTKKIQVLLTPEDEDNLNQVIIEKSMKRKSKPISISKYVRQLILEHIVNETSLENKLKK